MHRNTVVNGTIDLKCLNIECAFHLTQSEKFVSFSLSSIPICSCNRLCNCLVAFSIISVCFPCGEYYRTYYTSLLLIQVLFFLGLFVWFMNSWVHSISKLVNGLSRGLCLSIILVAFQMLFPVHIAIYCHRIYFKISQMEEECSNFADILFEMRSKKLYKTFEFRWCSNFWYCIPDLYSS